MPEQWSRVSQSKWKQPYEKSLQVFPRDARKETRFYSLLATRIDSGMLGKLTIKR